MSTGDALLQRRRSIDLVVVDRLLAVLLAAGALADAHATLPGLDAPTIASLVALAATVAWRRRLPAIAALVAIAAMAVFELVSGYAGDGSFQVAALTLDFYMLGRTERARTSAAPTVVVSATWLAGAVVVSEASGEGIGQALSAWALVGGMPYVVGRVLAAQSRLAQELAATAGRLEDEQQLRARRAAAEERNRVARELHDVIAHAVSVMVIQTTAAQAVVRADVEAARAALAIVESCGRDALVELRRIVGVLRHTGDDLTGAAVPGLSELGALVERARASGLPVELRVTGCAMHLSPGLDLVAYRVLQEALTNAIKHAGPARATVTLAHGARALELEILDTGRGPSPGRERGHGLVGMRERLGLYGGELRVGARAAGGFAVHAWLPLDDRAATGPAHPGAIPTSIEGGGAAPAHGHDPPPAGSRERWPWLDPAIAAVALVLLEAEALTSSRRHGPLVLDALAVAGLAAAALWRRRAPLAFLSVVGALSLALSAGLSSPGSATIAGAYAGLLPPYAVAAWEDRRRALLGLGLFVGGSALVTLLLGRGTPGDLAGSAFTVGAAWAVGRATRVRRARTAQLATLSARLVAEREDRARLAVAGERTRIARELHAVVAQSVAAMVVQAQAAERLLDGGQPAEPTMTVLEDTGRHVLVEMRRILGVLRHDEDGQALAPQPGVDQIHALIGQARQDGRPIELRVDGDPGTLPAGVDLGVYRILDEALRSLRDPEASVRVSLRFGHDELELRLTAHCPQPPGWPSLSVRERVALCGGELHADPEATDGWDFTARLPREPQGALV